MNSILWLWNPYRQDMVEREKRAKENQDKLIACLLAENEQRMVDILNSFAKSGDTRKYLERQNKQKEFMYHRIQIVLSCNNNEWKTN